MALTAAPPVGRLPTSLGEPPAEPATLPAWPLALATVALVTVAANYSLRTLVAGLRYSTPLAELGLVPLISVALAVWCRRGEVVEIPVRDRSVDFLLAVPSLLVATAILVALPGPTSSLFWALRLDLLALPLLAVGTVALVWGVQVAWRHRRALLFLVVAWPIPYTYVLGGAPADLQWATTTAVVALLRVLPLAGHVRTVTGPVFLVPHGGNVVQLAVTTPCSGADGVLSFLLIGGAAVLVMRGRRGSKLAWLACGATAALVANVLRVSALIVVGAHFGQRAALTLLHPWAGAALTAAVAGAAAWWSPRFGLHIAPRPKRTVPSQRPRPIWLVALAPLVVVLAIVDSHLSVFRPVVGDLGQARLESFATSPPVVSGWRLLSTSRVDWASQFFGGGASWERQLYVVTAPGLQPTVVTADAVATSDPGRFGAYSVADCFHFHGDHVLHHSHPVLGHGVTADEFAYREPGGRRAWVSLSWVWPVLAPHVRYERVSLVISLDDTSLHSVNAEGDALLGFARTVTAQRIDLARSR